MDARILDMFMTEMKIAKYSPVTIDDRMQLLRRLARHLDGKPLTEATGDDLRRFQARFLHLAPATINIYSRHAKAFFDWAHKRHLIEHNPAEEIIIPRVPRGRPHPTRPEDLRIVFACTRGALRIAYVLAAFAGLRRGEICRLRHHDVDLSQDATALIHGKGGRERRVPLLAPVVTELREYGLPRGWVLTRNGHPYPPERLSIDSTNHLHGLGLNTTLHSMRGTFATDAGRVTRDPLFVRDLLGHSSVATTEIYVQTNMNDAHSRLAGLSALANDILGARRAQTA